MSAGGRNCTQGTRGGPERQLTFDPKQEGANNTNSGLFTGFKQVTL